MPQYIQIYWSRSKIFFLERDLRSKGMCMYSRSRITEGAGIEILADRIRCPLCSSIYATPLKIITTARRSVQTFIGSNEALRTKTRPLFILPCDTKRTQDFVTSYEPLTRYEKIVTCPGNSHFSFSFLICEASVRVKLHVPRKRENCNDRVLSLWHGRLLSLRTLAPAA